MYKINTTKLRIIRNENDLSQEQLASKLLMNQSKYSRIESGKILPNLSDLNSICNFFQIQHKDIILENNNHTIYQNNTFNNSVHSQNIENYHHHSTNEDLLKTLVKNIHMQFQILEELSKRLKK